MELSHSLTLNEEALAQLPDGKKSLFIYEWLRFLENVLVAAQKSDVKESQKKIVEQLMAQIHSNPGPPVRYLIGQCLATLFSVGDAFLLFETINKLNDILKNKDDSAAFLMTRLASITSLGLLYEKLGRMAGRSYEETVQVLLRGLKNAESQTRAESMTTLGKLCLGMGSAAANQHRDIFKACKLCLADRNMIVRSAAARCLWEVLRHSPTTIQLNEFESIAALSFRALENSNHEVRCNVAYLLGNVAAAALTPKLGPVRTTPSSGNTQPAAKVVSVEEVLGIISTGFLRGGGGFLKGTGEMIKGPAATSREVRVGVTMSYVVMVKQLGSAWLERNLTIVIQHLLDLAAQPRAAPTHVDAVYSRQCIAYVLRSLLGKMLGEKQQTAACKELAHIINQQMNSIDLNPENAKDSSTQETIFSQHLLVCALQELGSLVQGLASSASALLADQGAGVIDCAIAVLLHPSQAARLAAAWSLQSMAMAVPCHLTLLIDKCVDALENLRSTPEAVAGYSAALAALIAGVSSSTLGIPHNRGKIVFNTAEELLRSASQNNRLAVQRTQAGWLLIGSVMTLGVSVVSSLVPRMLLLWRNSFPRSAKELDSEKARGDAFTWQVALEGRAGALSSICSFLRHCPQLATSEDITKRLMGPLDAAVTMLSSIAPVVKAYGQPLKAVCAMVRLRLYDALSLVPAQYYEASYTQLLRLLVAEFTLAENPANTTTSLLNAHCHPDDAAMLLNCDILDNDSSQLQQQLVPNSNAVGSGALEHDPCSLYALQDRSPQRSMPGPLPLGVAVIDTAITLFGHVFPRVLHKHRLQLLIHFEDSIKQAKTRQAIQINVFAALLAALRNVAEAKTGFGTGGEELRKGLSNLIQAGLINNTSPALRCAAAEAMGRLAQAGADQRFTNETILSSFDKLKSSRDAASRTGHSLALGCLHRYGGGLALASSQQLNSSISILMALGQDTSSALVQHWALHALASIGETSGPVFRPFVDPCSKMALNLLLTVPFSNVDVHRSVGRCCAALVIVFGPELQGNTGSITSARSSLLSAFALLQQHSSPVVQAEAITCLQQLHMFAPRHVNLSTLVPVLCRSISSNHLGLRRAAVSCLRQLVQREAREVCQHASSYTSESGTVPLFNGSEQGLASALFILLDSETDAVLQRHIRDTITGLLTSLAEQQLSGWLNLCKEVLTASAESAPTTIEQQRVQSPSGYPLKAAGSETMDADAGDDEEEFRAGVEQATATTRGRPIGVPLPRWPTRVFAAQTAGKLLLLLRESKTLAHFDLAAARQLRAAEQSSSADYLVLHLPDLIRLAFIAATSDCDALRLEGLRLLQLLIDGFAAQQEPEFPGHSILEQYQAQISAALRPAFSADTAPNVTAAACHVCSTWMCCGVAKDLAGLRRVQQLLLSALNRISAAQQSSSLPPLSSIGGLQQHRLYNESAATLENLSVLKAWAEVYITAMGTRDSTDDSPLLLPLVKPELSGLVHFWLAALKDHALLSLPSEFGPQLPPEGGTFYTHDAADLSRPYYKLSWPPLLQAAALWLGFKATPKSDPASATTAPYEPDNVYSNHFFLVFGIALEALCDLKSTEPDSSTAACLAALQALLHSPQSRSTMSTQPPLSVEVCNVLHRVILTKNAAIKHLAFNVLLTLVEAAKEHLSSKDDPGAGEGGAEGELLPGTSLVFAALEVCLCLLVQFYPSIEPSSSSSNNSNAGKNLKRAKPSQADEELIATALNIMGLLPSICSTQGALSLLPALLHLVTSVLKEAGPLESPAIQAALQCLQTFSSHPYSKMSECQVAYGRLLQSCAARLLDWGKAGQLEDRLQPQVLLSAVTQMLLNAHPGLLSCPALLYPSLNAFQQSLQSADSHLRLHTIGLFAKLLQDSKQQHDSSCAKRVVTPYVHALAPKIVAHLCSPAARNVDSQQELLITIQSINCLEALTALTEPEHCSMVLQLLVPILISCLLDASQLKLTNHLGKALHGHALCTLTRVGSQYPLELKTLLSQLPDLRTKLESAARANQTAVTNKMGALSVGGVVDLKSAPTIKLKTDFSNFSLN